MDYQDQIAIKVCRVLSYYAIVFGFPALFYILPLINAVIFPCAVRFILRVKIAINLALLLFISIN